MMIHRPKPEGGSAKPRHDGRFSTFRSSLLQLLREIWPDILTLAVLGGITLGLHQVPLAARRTFPVTFDPEGRVVYPDLAYPYRGWIISTTLSGVLSAIVPIFFVLLAQIRVRSLRDTANAVMGILLADILGTMFSVVTKKLVGGFRPYFLDVCQPDVSLAKGQDGGLNGSGYHQIMYTSDICTNPDKKQLLTAMTSFPSGHSVAAFAGYGVLFLYLNGKLKVWSDHKPDIWKFAVLFAPLLGAFLIACSLSIDAAHNWWDIAVGIVIGTVFAFASYRMFYAAVWDWRFNHVPLRREAHAYAHRKFSRAGVFTRAGGWGVRDLDGVSGKAQDESSVRSSTTVTHGQPHAGGARFSTQNRYGDDMV